MKTNLFVFISLLLLISLPMVSCKKDKEKLSLSGFVQDPNSGQYISGVSVTLQASGVSSGVFNAGYQTIGEYVSGSDGSFTFEVDESSYASFRINLFKQNFFLASYEISASNITPESPYHETLNIFPEGFISLHVINSDPYDADDLISFFYNNPPVGCAECCSNDIYQLEGATVDTVLKCKTYGNRQLVLVATIIKNSITTVKMDTIDVPALDTVMVDFNY